MSEAAAQVEERSSVFAEVLRAYEWIAQREKLACAAVLFLTLAARAAMLPWRPPPEPAVADEFAYLLGAETFAAGRLANPPHPMWQHFEPFNELMQPVYASKYPPLQSLTMAFGEKLFGQPWVGVFLSAGLMCAAICWMLQGWISLNLAFLGGLLCVMRIGVFSYWMNSYWGGAVAAIGGALVLGALPRLWGRKQERHWITLACGLAVLMHSRPWEGAVLGASALGVLAWNLAKTDSLGRLVRSKGMAAAMAILMVSFGAMAYLDYRITGSPFVMPHSLWDGQYMVTPNFAFLPLKAETPVYRHAEYRAAYLGWHMDAWRFDREHAVKAVLSKAFELYIFFFGFWPVMLLPLFWPYRLKTMEERAAVILAVVFLAVAIFPQAGFADHYAAPAAGLFYARFLQTLARWSEWRPSGRPVGTAFASLFVVLFGIHFVASAAARLQPGGMPAPPFATARSSMARALAREPGRQLVLVRYEAGHDPSDEWVWNGADIDASQTVWARAMGPDRDRELIQYYRGRKVWMLDADRAPLRLIPYSGQ